METIVNHLLNDGESDFSILSFAISIKINMQKKWNVKIVLVLRENIQVASGV